VPGLNDGKRYALKFISGKYEGGVFKLPRSGQVIIGRSSGVDVVIVEDMVSRQHARIGFEDDGGLYIEDLGSTNGSFVNGERITRTRLKEGDRILIGTSILKVMTVEDRSVDKRTMPISDLTLAPPEEQLGNEHTRTSSMKSMEGLLSEIPLVDILQMFSTGQKTGQLTLKSPPHTGWIHMRSGQIVWAAIEGLPDMPPLKALYRMLDWNEGHFEMGSYQETPTGQDEISDSTQMLIMEGMRQIDERRLLVERLGLEGALLRVNFPLANPLKDLQSEELDLFQLLMQETAYEDLLDKVQHDDLKTTEMLATLLDGKYIKKI
jgi:hypothetical protein